MKMYRGLEVPDISKDKFRLGISSHTADNQGCYGGTSIDYHDDSTINCTKSGVVCTNCILDVDNIEVGIDYLVKEGFITKAEALIFNLDG